MASATRALSRRPLNGSPRRTASCDSPMLAENVTPRRRRMATAEGKVGYRAEVVGSLLRPDYLKEAWGRFERAEIDTSELSALQDRAAIDAIRLQEESGVDVLTDGEVRRRF